MFSMLKFATKSPILCLFSRQMMSKIPFVPVTIDDQSIQQGANQVLNVVRPEWMSNTGASYVKSKVFTEGLSNKIVGFFAEDNKEDIVIVKVFGANTDRLIDREAEIETMKLLHERNCGAELYATFTNGICYQFINGMTLTVEHCQDTKLYPKVAAEMARMHSEIQKNQDIVPSNDIPVPGGSNSNSNNSGATNNNQKNHRNFNQPGSYLQKSLVWSKLRQFNELSEEVIADDIQFKDILAKIGITPGWGAKTISELESIFEKHKDIPVTFCHNDLLPLNIVYNSETQKITFIDIEYAMYNYAPFDVANHFLEFAGVDQIDYTKYPNQTFRNRWLQEYLKHFRVVGHNQPTIEKFDFWVQLCVPLSHLMWALWGIYQAKHSTIEFDYVGYVQLRLSEFQKHLENLRQSNGSTTQQSSML